MLSGWLLREREREGEKGRVGGRDSRVHLHPSRVEDISQDSGEEEGFGGGKLGFQERGIDYIVGGDCIPVISQCIVEKVVTVAHLSPHSLSLSFLMLVLLQCDS